MPDFARIKRNVAKMAAQNAPIEDIDGYIESEGATVEQIRNFSETKPRTDNPYKKINEERGAIENLYEGLKTGAKSRVLGLGQLAMEATGNTDSPYYEDMQTLAKQYRQQSEGTGVAGTIGEIAGDPLTAAMLPFAPAAAGVKGAIQMGLAGGAAAGATAPYAEGEDRTTGTITNAVIGGVAAPVLSTVGKYVGRAAEKYAINPAKDLYTKAASWMANNADDKLAIEIKGLMTYDDFANAAKSLGDDAVAAYRQASKSGLSPKQSYLAAKATTKGVTIPRGDLLQDAGLQRLQDQAKMNLLGDDAYKVATSAEQANEAAMRNYGNQLLRDVTGSDSPLVDETSVANSVGRAVRNRAEALKVPASEAFNAGMTTKATVAGDEFAGMHKQLRSSLVESGFDLPDMPKASRLLNTMRRAENIITKRGGDAKYKSLEIFRKRINKSMMSSADPAEKEAIRQIQSAYTDKLDDIITNDLLKNPDEAAVMLREAPALWRTYKQTIFGKDGKAALGKIVKHDMTDRQIADLFGSSAWGKGDTHAVVSQLKNALGADSPEFGQVRGMFVNRLLKGALEDEKKGFGVAIRSNLKKLEMNNKQLYNELFDEAMQKEIDDFANIAWTLSNKVKSKVNPTNSGVYAFGAAKSLLDRMGVTGQLASNALRAAQGGAENAALAKQATQSIMEPLRRAGADTRVISEGLRKAGMVVAPVAASQERNILQ